jgi:4-cresol dehydrogenase (hydroxylating)
MGGFRKRLSFGYWNASGGLYGTSAQISEAKRLLRKALARAPGRLKFLNLQTLRLAKRYAGLFRMLTGWDMTRTVELVEPVLGLMRGVPTNHALSSAYWRKRCAVPAEPDPDRDRCGLLWHAPMARADGQHVATLTATASEILLRWGFEPMISLTMLTPRSVYCVLSISYDRDVAGEDEKAMACYDELAARCAENGFYPYRLGIQGMGHTRRADAYRQLIQTLKSALDPNDVIAPGRYDERAASDLRDPQNRVATQRAAK